MACRVPGCSTRYWDKTNKHTMFRAPSTKQLADWRKILTLKGVNDFDTNDLICILHFKEAYIERQRVIHQSGGTVSKQPRKVLLLTSDAVPTIFPSEIPKTVRKKRQKLETHLKHASQTLDADTLAKQREIFKRKLMGNDDVKCPKRMKTNNLFRSVANAIRNHKRVSPYLSSLWIANICDEKCIKWSLWKTDRSGEEKSINLYEDLRVDLFVNEKKIFLPKMDKVAQISDLQNLFKKVSCILPCKRADFKSQGSGTACLGFVVENVHRQRAWCAQCCKYQINLKRNVAKQNLPSRCSRFRRKNELLKMKVRALNRNLLSFKKQCKETDEKTLNEAIENLPSAVQAAIQSCFTASRAKDTRGMKHTTKWVYECLLLHIKSRKTYELLRKRKILVLPDITTLNNYIKRINGCYGFRTSLFEVIAEKTKRIKCDEVRGTLLIDEIKLTKALSFNRQNLRVEGFTDLGKYTSHHQKGKKGDHALTFMFQPYKGKWIQSLGCFLSKGSAVGTVLHHLIIECIALAEKSGLRIDVLAMNGASWNRDIWEIFGVTKQCVSVPHVIDPKRHLWFVSDFPHLIKCMCNFFTHKIRDKYPGIWTPDGIVSLRHWDALLKVENENILNSKVNFKLRKEHLDPEFHKEINVAIAFQFFGLADAMESLQGKHSDLANCGSTIQFSRRVKSLITAMNSRIPINNLKPGNAMWKVIEKFIVYLDNWEVEAKQKGIDFIPDQIYYGLQISLRSALQVCTFLVEKCGFSYLMPSRLNQDSLERFLGWMRDYCKSNEQPDSILFIQMYRLISTFSLAKPFKRSNISGGEILDILLSLQDITDVDERWEHWTGQIDTLIDRGINCDQLLDAASILEEYNYFDCTTSDYILTYISGFVARKSSRFIANDGKETCDECTRSLLLDPAEEIPGNQKLIQLKSYGYLQHPSKTLFALISLLEHETLKAIRKKDFNIETLFDVTNAIEHLPSTPLVGCTKHAPTLTQRIITFYLTMRMYFLCK